MSTWHEDRSLDAAGASPSAQALPEGSGSVPLDGETVSAGRSTRLSAGARTGLVLGWAIAIAALVAVLLLWRSQSQMREQLAQNLALLGTQTRDLTLQLQTATQQGEQARARAGLLEEKLAEFDAQRSRTNAILENLTHSQQDVLLADLRATLQAAQMQAGFSGSPQPLLLALTEAEKRLAVQQHPRLAAIHRAVAQDLARMKTARFMDTSQLANMLEIVLQRLDALPLLGTSTPALYADAPARPVVVAPQSRWLRLWQHAKESLMQLVRVRTIASTDAALIAPEQAIYVREHLRLRLLNARTALLARQSDAARTDMDAAGTLIDRYFDTKSTAVQSAQSTLRQVQQQIRESEPPAITHTLQALAAAENDAAAAPVAATSAASR